MCPKKVPWKVIVLWFFGAWSQRRPRVVPKTHPSPFQGQIWSKFVQKKVCARNNFCDVLLGLVPDWTHMPSGASAVLPDFHGLFQSSHLCNLQRATARDAAKKKQTEKRIYTCSLMGFWPWSKPFVDPWSKNNWAHSRLIESLPSFSECYLVNPSEHSLPQHLALSLRCNHQSSFKQGTINKY